MKLSREEVVRRVNAHLIQHLRFEASHEVKVVSPLSLLSAHRFDVLAKYIYAKHRRLGNDLSWAISLYRAHLEVWGGFEELDGSGKNSFEKYLQAFNSTLDQVERKGFDTKESILPVGRRGQIIDGAHRLASCIAHGIEPTVVIFDHDEERYSADSFSNMGLSEVYLDAMAVEYAKLKPQCHIVCLFPKAISRVNDVRKTLEQYGSVVYEKAILFENNGPINLIAQLYKGEHWLGRRSEGWPGAESHVRNKFEKGVPVTFFLYECADLLLVKEVKARIRSLYDMGNDSVHVNDTYEETVRIAEQVFNANSVHLLNEGDLTKPYRIHEWRQQFLQDIQSKGYNPDSLIVDASSVLALYGLRDSNDLDFLSATGGEEKFSNELIRCHNKELGYYAHTLGQMLHDPSLHLYYDGLKYCTLGVVAAMKRNRSEEKDFDDLRLIQNVGCGEKVVFKKPYASRAMKRRLRELVKIVVPASLRPTARRLFNAIRDGRNLIRQLPETFRSGDLSMLYQGWTLYYSPRTSLIERIRFGQIYEPDVTTAIVRSLQKNHAPVVIDVGANIGLITLNILKYYPSAKIFAFEPGPHQRQLLTRTINSNQLAGKVQVSDLALSDTNGVTTFTVHSSRHSSGDGFKDTGRAGRARQINVTTQRLDDWWKANNEPCVHLLKIDTEGAELAVLRGAHCMLSKLAPIILFELCLTNLAVYSHSAHDVYDEIVSLGYQIKTLAGTEVTRDKLASYMELFEEFLAIPSSRFDSPNKQHQV